VNAIAARDRSLLAEVAGRVRSGRVRRHSVCAPASLVNVVVLVLRWRRAHHSVKRYLRGDALGSGDSAQRRHAPCGASLSSC